MSAEHDIQLVTLGIGQEVFAVPVAAVLEILDMRPIFRLPDAPPYLAGLVDVRGRGVPAIDLRIKLGLPPVPTTESTRILVLQVPLGKRDLTLGLITDRVFEVVAIDEKAIEPAPDIGVTWRSDYIRGVTRRGDSFVVIFDLAQLFSSAELGMIDARAAGVPDIDESILGNPNGAQASAA